MKMNDDTIISFVFLQVLHSITGNVVKEPKITPQLPPVRMDEST